MKITVLENIQKANDVIAEEIHAQLDSNKVLTINLMSSPGAGKTTLLERTCEFFKEKGVRIGIIEGDMETTRDASGSPTTRARTETYWDRAKVTLSGSLAVDFDVEFCEWDADMTVEALRHEADTWFRHGLERLQESHMRETIESLNEEATALTSRIRSSLEDSTFASS